jgi:short-subunit dehydrogenase involved in D-alanine esterification of teichoic acids
MAERKPASQSAAGPYVNTQNRSIDNAMCKHIDCNSPEMQKLEVPYQMAKSFSTPNSTSRTPKALLEGIVMNQVADVLLNNADFDLNKDLSFRKKREPLDTNFRSTLEMCDVFIPLLRERT